VSHYHFNHFSAVCFYYFRRCLASGEGIVSLASVKLSRCVCVRLAATACPINLGGEGNALYSVLSSL